MSRRLILALTAVAVALAGALFAGEETAPPRDGPYRVTAVIDGDTLVLDSGREVRLVGIQAPKLPLGRKGFKAWPLAEEAKVALEAITLGQEVELGLGQQAEDRHGRILAHIYLADGTWAQGEMLTRGMARVYSFHDNRALVAELLALETAARGAGEGIWALEAYRPRGVEELEARIGRFELIEGQVADVAVVRGRGYLNFGSDWRSDFTASLAPDVMRRFAAESIELDNYRHQWLRLRGWLKSYNGPMIEITHPEQIEVLAE